MIERNDMGAVRRDPLQRASRVLEQVLVILLATVAIFTIGFAVFAMLHLDASSRSQGGRYLIAVLALVVLGAINGVFRRLVHRRAGFHLTPTREERQYAALGLLVMALAALVLIGSAHFLP